MTHTISKIKTEWLSNSYQSSHSAKKGEKLNAYPRADHEGPEGEQRHSCTLSLTLTLDGGGWSMPRPGRFTPGKETRYPLCRWLDGTPRPFRTGKENIARTRIPSPDCPAHCESLYRRYPCPPHLPNKKVNCRPENLKKSFNHHPPYTHFCKVDSSLQDFPLSLRYMSWPNHQS